MLILLHLLSDQVYLSSADINTSSALQFSSVNQIIILFNLIFLIFYFLLIRFFYFSDISDQGLGSLSLICSNPPLFVTQSLLFRFVCLKLSPEFYLSSFSCCFSVLLLSTNVHFCFCSHAVSSDQRVIHTDSEKSQCTIFYHRIDIHWYVYSCCVFCSNK